MANMTILLVDDSESNRVLFERMVEQHMPECDLYMAVNAKEGFALAEEIQPDCAVLDVHMPGTSGIELCRMLKAKRATANFPVLLITAQGPDSKQRIAGIEAGADDLIERPWSDAELVAKIRVMFRIKHAEDQLRESNRRLAGTAGQRSQELQELDERFRLLFESTSDPVFLLEINEDGDVGRFLDANAAGGRLIASEHESIIGQPIHRFLPNHRHGAARFRIQSLETDPEQTIDTMLLTQRGEEIPVRLRARLCRLRGERSILAIVQKIGVEGNGPVSDDNTGFRMLADKMGVVIYDNNIRTWEAEISGALEGVLGLTPGEFEEYNGGRWRELIHPDDRTKMMETFKVALRDLGHYQLEYRILHSSGTFRYVEDAGVVIPGEDGKALRAVGSIKDVTQRTESDQERRRIEDEAQHAQRLESLGVLAGGIAHDFNNILAAIIGLTDLALMDLPEDSGTHQDLREALHAGHRARDLVKQILAFSRQTGSERNPVYLHVIAREALKLLRASIPVTIDVIDSVHTDSGAVMANAGQMHQIVMNLCTNAAQAVKQGGRLELRVEDVTVDAATAAKRPRLEARDYVVMTVSDNGHGISPQLLSRIFDPFFTTKGPGEGTGLGLSVVHGIVTSHGGAIYVDSALDQGTDIVVFLPKTTADVVPKLGPDRYEARGGERVMLVDDEPAVLRFLAGVLPRMGYEVDVFSDSTEALTHFRSNAEAYSAVVTDLLMPAMTGDILARALKECRPDIPIVLFTGFSEDLESNNPNREYIAEVVMKPVIGEDLACAIRRAIDGTGVVAAPSN